MYSVSAVGCVVYVCVDCGGKMGREDGEGRGREEGVRVDCVQLMVVCRRGVCRLFVYRNCGVCYCGYETERTRTWAWCGNGGAESCGGG